MEYARAQAEQGLAEAAQVNLGKRYATREGVEQDYREVYICWLLAQAGGYEKARQGLSIVGEHLASSELRFGKAEAKKRFARIEARKN